MSRLLIRAFSKSYAVRRLTAQMLPDMLSLCIGNTQYYAYCGRQPSEELLLADLTLLPPNKTADDKYYVGLYDGDTLVAMLDLIDGYPDAQTAFIGFFMLRNDLQGCGRGSRIIGELLAYLSDAGFSRVRLGIDKGNPQSTHFWTKNGFDVLYEVQQEQGCILVAERALP